MEEKRIDIEELPLFKLTSNEIKPEDLENVLAQINASDLEEWIKLHLASKAYCGAGNYEGALNLINSGLRNLKIPATERWRFYYNKAACLCDLGKNAEALKVCDILFAGGVFPEKKICAVYFLLGKIFYNQKQYKQALDYFILASENNPPENFVFVLYTYKIRCYIEIEEEWKALDVIKEALDKKPPADILWWLYQNQGEVLFCFGRFQESLEAINKALAANPPASEWNGIMMSRTFACLKLKQYQEALNNCVALAKRRVLEENPSDEWCFLRCAIVAACYCELGNYEEGLASCEQALQRYSPRSEGELRYLKFWNGRCLLALGRADMARECFAQCGAVKADSGFYLELCDKIISNGGEIKNGVLTLKL